MRDNNHISDCKAFSSKHIYAHNLMVNFLIKKLKKRKARLVSAQNLNTFKDGSKADIQLKYNNQSIYLDVGFSKHPDAYYQQKVNKYKDKTKDTYVPIIFGKNVTIHPKSLECLL